MVGRLSGREKSADALQIGGSIDTDRSTVNDCNADAHASFECPELFQTLTLFEGGRRQRYETVECGSTVGINADVMEQRADAMGAVARVKYRALSVPSGCSAPTTFTTFGSVRS